MTLIDPKDKARLLFAAIGVVALLGMLAITVILMFWRRQIDLLSRPGRRAGGQQEDAWRIAGERMQTPPAEAEGDVEEGHEEE